MSKRYTYLRSGPVWWGIDTAKAPASLVCLVLEPNGEATQSDEARRICDVLNRDHEIAEQVAEATRRKDGGA